MLSKREILEKMQAQIGVTSGGFSWLLECFLLWRDKKMRVRDGIDGFEMFGYIWENHFLDSYFQFYCLVQFLTMGKGKGDILALFGVR